MTTIVLTGAGLGLGLWMLLIAVLPPAPSLATALTATQPARPATTVAALNHDEARWILRIGRPLGRMLARVGAPSDQQRRDLRIIGRPVEVLVAHQAIGAAAGLLLPGSVFLVLAGVGLPVGWAVPSLATLASASLGWLLPLIQLRTQAQRARAALRHGLAAYLNLVRVLLAGGAGIDGALDTAARASTSWAFTLIRTALTQARMTRTTPWQALGELGHDLDMDALVEMAAAVSLAGTEGARVRASLTAKATALRTRELTEAETDAQAATERMSLPIVCLFAGFLLFLSYPAVMTVLGSL